MEKEKSRDLLVQECLQHLGISSLGQWDILVFVYRHQVSLASSEQVARLVGYSAETIDRHIEALESLRLIQRSKSSQGVRLTVNSKAFTLAAFRHLMSLAENRTGRLLLSKTLKVKGNGNGRK